MKPFNILLSLFLSLVLNTASAVPLTTTGDSGYRGDDVNVILTEPTPDNLDSLWIDILFNPLHLAYGDLISNVLDIFTVDLTDVAAGKVGVVLSAPATINSGSTELMQLTFEILNGAPSGNTLVTFQCHDEGQGCFDYAFEPVQAMVTVLDSNRIPLPATLWLMVLGFGMLVRVRARR